MAKKRKRRTKERSYFDGSRKWGLRIGMFVGLVMAGAGTYNSMREVATWGDDFVQNIDAVYEGNREDRFVVSPPTRPGEDPVVYHLTYAGVGAGLALICAAVAGFSRNSEYEPLKKKDLPHVSFAKKNASGRYVIRP